MNKSRILALIVIIGLNACGTSRLSEKQARELAELHVSQLQQNTFGPKAVFASKGLRRWTVGFKSNLDSTRYRFVRIYRNGKRIEIEHQDLKISME